jgi:hypothetical protein
MITAMILIVLGGMYAGHLHPYAAGVICVGLFLIGMISEEGTQS